MAVAKAKFHIYVDSKGEFRWRLHARNGRIMADSGEGYEEKWRAGNAIRVFKELITGDGVAIVDDTKLPGEMYGGKYEKGSRIQTA